MSICIVNIGRTKSGKTTRTIKLAKEIGPSRKIVNDVQRERKYAQERYILPFYGSKEDYLKKIASSRNTVVIIEEATMYFPHGGGYGEIVALLLKKRFTGNAFILNFHSLRQVPDYILDYVDYMYIGKSKGNISTLSKKFEDTPEVLEAWEYVRKSENPYEYVEVKL